MEYTEMLEALKEHGDNLPEGITLEAVKQAHKTLPDLYEATKKASEIFTQFEMRSHTLDYNAIADVSLILQEALAKAETEG